MPRPLRLAFENGIYHVTARGNNGECIFLDDYDRYAFLALMARIGRLQVVHILAYGLMTNHLHLVIQTPMANISATMHRLNGPYAYTFNRRHGRKGHLFERRFYSKIIHNDVQLLETTRYIHLNPVEAGLVKAPQEYPWTSYRFYIQEMSQSLVDPRPVLELLSRDAAASRKAYVCLVNAQIAAKRGLR